MNTYISNDTGILYDNNVNFRVVSSSVDYKGSESDEYTLYASHSTWDSKHAFTNWTKSEAFRQAHKNAGSAKNIYIGHPKFEGFEVII